MTVDLRICPSISDSFSFMYFEALWFCAHTFRITAFLVNCLFFFSISDNFLIQKPTCSGIFNHTILDSMATVVDRKLPLPPNSQRCPCPNPWNLWACYLTGQGDFVNVTKISRWRWEHYPGYLSEPSVVMGFLLEGDQRVRVNGRGCEDGIKRLQWWEEGVGSRALPAASGSWKGRGTDSYCSYRKQAALLTPQR